MLRVGVILEHGQDGLHCVLHAAHKADINRGSPAQILTSDINLNDFCLGRIKLSVGEVGAKQKQNIAAFNRPVAGCEAKQASHADVIRVVIFNELLTPQSMNHRCLQLLCNRQQLAVGPFNACSPENGDLFGCIEQISGRLQTIIGWAHDPWHVSNRG